MSHYMPFFLLRVSLKLNPKMSMFNEAFVSVYMDSYLLVNMKVSRFCRVNTIHSVQAAVYMVGAILVRFKSIALLNF